jgi:chromosomal replication initiation ATPase DnaA
MPDPKREREKPRQLPLDLQTAAGYSRDDLVVSAANAAAAELIDRWPDWPAPVVVLAGPAGSGKSHLAAIWREASHATALPVRAIGVDVSESAGPFLIDDADAADLDEVGLFHLINHVRGSGTHLLLTARRLPAAWGIRLPDLASRLKAAATVEISEPDDALLSGVITKLFADRQVEIEPHVVQYLIRRIERSLSTAIRVVERLDRVALEEKSRVTRAMAMEVVTALDEGQGEFGL